LLDVELFEAMPLVLDLVAVALFEAMPLVLVLVAVALLEAVLLELLAAAALAVVLVFSNAAISASTTAISEDTICASVALALDFEASSVATCFSREASCFCKAAICAVLLLELLDPMAETMALSCTFGGLHAHPLVM
jgi:hypothetical protein